MARTMPSAAEARRAACLVTHIVSHRQRHAWGSAAALPGWCPHRMFLCSWLGDGDPARPRPDPSPVTRFWSMGRGARKPDQVVCSWFAYEMALHDNICVLNLLCMP